MYAAIPYNCQNLNNVSLDALQWSISDQLFLETLLMNIRGKTISFASWKKRQALQKERELEERIIETEELLHNELSLGEENKLTSLNNYKENLINWEKIRLREPF